MFVWRTAPDPDSHLQPLRGTRFERRGTGPSLWLPERLSKGLRRLEQLCQGDFRRSLGLISGLPVALEVPEEVVKTAIEASQRQLREAEKTAWRTVFRPHAIILTERARPEPLFVAAVIGVERLLRLDFDPALGPVTYITQSLDALKQRLARWNGMLPAFGRPVGFIVNFTPDSAVRFDLEGNEVEMLDQAYRPWGGPILYRQTTHIVLRPGGMTRAGVD